MISSIVATVSEHFFILTFIFYLDTVFVVSHVVNVQNVVTMYLQVIQLLTKSL